MSYNLIEEICQSLDQYKDQAAIEEKGILYSYKELKEAVYFLTNLLNKNHCKKVAVIGEPSFLTVASVLSVILSEATYIPIEPSWPLRRIKKILQHSGADTVISYVSVLKKHSLDLKDLDIPLFFKWDLMDSNKSLPVNSTKNFKPQTDKTNFQWNSQKIKQAFRVTKYSHSQFEKNYPLEDSHAPFTLPKKTKSSVAYIMYTSGSSGEPKGVKVSLKALQKFLHWVKEEFQVSSTDCFSYTASLSFGASIRQVLSPALSGSQICCFQPETVKNPYAFLQELKQKQITLLNTPPIVLQQLAEQALKQKLDKHFLKNVRLVLAGGDLFPKKIVDFWYEQFQHPHSVINLYGSTESIVNASCYKTSNKNRGLFSYKLLPIGKPRPDLNFLLKDKQGKIIEETEKVGELYIKSSFLSSGYHNNKPENEKTFSFLNQENKILYNTGDRALRLLSKDYLVLGREDTQVQIYGQRLELGEIENTLNSHPQVQRALVIHFKQDHFDKIVAYIQPTDQQNYSETALKNFLNKELPSYMVPHEFRKIDRIPTTNTNKVDYKKLQKTAKEKFTQTYKHDLSENKDLSSLSDTELANEIKKLWRKYLGNKEFTNHQSFFDSGGDSILTVSLYQSLCERFNVSLNPYIFYTSPTINNIVKTLRQTQNRKTPVENPEKTENRSVFKALSANGIKKFLVELFLKALKLNNKIISLLYRKPSVKRGPQSPQQKSFVFMKKLFSETYNGLFSVPVQNSFDKGEFKKALQLVIHYQESLRTVFVGDEQIILSDYPADILFYDLKNQSEKEQKNIIKKTEEKLLKQNFNFSELPLFKLALFDLTQTKSHLTFCINHIVGDGWSLQAFLSELNQSYSFLKKGGTAIFLHSYLEYTKKYKTFCRQNFETNKMFWDKKMTQLSEYNLSPKCKSVDLLSHEESLRLTPSFQTKASIYAKKQHTQEFYVYLTLWVESLREFLACSKICFWTTYHGRSFHFKRLNTMIGSVARAAPLFMELHTEDKTELLKAVQTGYLDSLNHTDFNIAKTFISSNSKTSVLNNWIGFNYLDFRHFPQLTTSLPFYMDFSQGKVRLSSSEKSYQRLYLFFSVHNYEDHIELRVYGKALQEHKKQLLQLMKNKWEQLC